MTTARPCQHRHVPRRLASAALDTEPVPAQFLPSTWATTPQDGQRLSPLDPTANMDAAIWLARTKGWQQWQVYTVGQCH